MHTITPAGLQALTRRLEKRRRLFYLIASLAGVPSIFAVWLQHHNDIPFVANAYPLLIATGVLWSIALLIPRIPLAWIERSVLTIVGLFFLSKLIDLWFFTSDINQVWSEVEAVYWVIAILFILAYVIFERGAALIFNLVLLALTLMLGGWRFWRAEPALQTEYVRLEVRIAAIGFLLFTLARTKDEFNQTLAAVNHLEQMANTDSLTRLPNRRELNRLLEDYLASRQTFTLILVDIDHFKLINDTFGHDQGDSILQEISDCLHHQIRAGDVIGRWGGEEFLIMTRESEAQSALQLAERLRQTVEAYDFSASIPVTASFGVTLATQHDTPHTLVKRADLALYRAKGNGRNCVEWEPPEFRL